MHCKSKQKCDNCENIKKKLELYDNFVKEMKHLEIKDEYSGSLGESIIIEKDNYGHNVKKVPSDLTESFLIVENGKNINELNKKDQAVLKEQDSYYNYKNTSNHFQKANIVYKGIYYTLSVGKWLLLL